MSDPNNYGSSDIDRLLDDRGRTHGDFVDHARITGALKNVLNNETGARSMRGQAPLSYAAAESLSMICHKIGRIIAGKWDTTDHWDDIAGYARLVSRSLDKPEPTQRRSVFPVSARVAAITVGWESPPPSDNPGDDPGDQDGDPTGY